MGLVEDISQPRGLPSKSYRQATIGPLFIKMSEDISANVTDAKEWGNRPQGKKCLSNLSFTPYDLVYGKRALFSIEFEYNTLRMEAQLDLDLSHAQQERLMQLNGLDELQMQALLHSKVTQLQRKVWHDRHLNDKQFQPGDWALLYDSRHKDFKGKLRTRWLGPYAVEKCNDNGSVLIWTIDE
eukprot:PITA_10967